MPLQIGGGGIARQIASRHPDVQIEFRKHAGQHPETLQLGKAIFLKSSETLTFAALIAQDGCGPSDEPRIRYDALALALEKLGTRARVTKASVHMPRIGVGAARGRWEVIEPMIQKYVVPFADVRIYEIPRGKRRMTRESS